jgi:hypothetical protein
VGELPAGTATGSFGATVVATITLLLGVYGLSRRDTADLMRDLFGRPISLGAVVGCQRIGAAALAQPHEEALAPLPNAPVKYADETGWKLGDVYVCLWVVVTPAVKGMQITWSPNDVLIASGNASDHETRAAAAAANRGPPLATASRSRCGRRQAARGGVFASSPAPASWRAPRRRSASSQSSSSFDR